MLDQQKINELRQQKIAPQKLFINGGWQAAISGQTIDIISPINGQVITTTADAGAEDVDRAVVAARAAFEKGSWANMAPAERKKIMLKAADLIEKNALELAVLGGT